MNKPIPTIFLSTSQIDEMYNIICRIWEYYVDGKVNAYIRTLMIKEIPTIDKLLIDEMNSNGLITNIGDDAQAGFKITTEKAPLIETHLYFADFDDKIKDSRKIAVSAVRPLFANGKYKNIVLFDRSMFGMEVAQERTGVLINHFAGLFSACFNTGGEMSHAYKYLCREIYANYFIASVNNFSAKLIRSYSNTGNYFCEEAEKYLLEYMETLLSFNSNHTPPFIVSYPLDITIEDLLQIISILQYQHKHTKVIIKSNKKNDDGDYGDESSDSV